MSGVLYTQEYYIKEYYIILEITIRSYYFYRSEEKIEKSRNFFHTHNIYILIIIFEAAKNSFIEIFFSKLIKFQFFFLNSSKVHIAHFFAFHTFALSELQMSAKTVMDT